MFATMHLHKSQARKQITLHCQVSAHTIWNARLNLGAYQCIGPVSDRNARDVLIQYIQVLDRSRTGMYHSYRALWTDF